MIEFGMGWVPSPGDPRDWTPATLKAMIGLKVAVPVSWAMPPGLYLYQDGNPFCVGYSGGYLTAAAGSQSPIDITVDDAFCDGLYAECKAVEGIFPGEPAFMEGSCLRSLGKALRNRGIIDAYALTSDWVAADQWVENWGPVPIGVYWWTGMFNPDEHGVILPSGRREGGHAIIWRAKDQPFNVLRNSWGKSWGVDSEALLSDMDLAGLLSDQGEALLTVKLAAHYYPPAPKKGLCHWGKAMKKRGIRAK